MSKVAELRKRIKSSTTGKEMTQRELADIVGVTETTVRNWENNRSGVDWFERIGKLCKALNCSPEDLIEYKSVEEGEIQ